MQPLIWDRRPDGLRAPALVCAFQGWNDAGDAASSAVAFLASSLHASRFARVESEEFFKRHMATKGTELAEACVAIIGQLAAVA